MNVTGLKKNVSLLAAGLVFMVATVACDGTASPTPTPRNSATTPVSAGETPAVTQPPAPTAAPTPTHIPTQSPTSTVIAAASPSPAPAATPTPTAAPSPTAAPTLEPWSPQLPSSITDAKGNEVTVTDISRIVVLNGDFAEVVFALGLGDNVVAVDVSATYPPSAAHLPKVGYQRSLSAEGILAMEPTVVIGSTSAGPPEVIEQVQSAGATVVILEAASTLDGAARKIRDIAQALGAPTRGETIATDLEAQISEVKALAAQVEEQPTAVFLYMRGVDQLFMGGQGDLSHELFEAAGAVSGGAAAGIRAPFVPLTAEALVAANPDCLVVFTTGLETVGGRDGLTKLPGVGQTVAAETGCILDFDGQYLVGGGPRTGQALMELFAAFHPDLAPSQQ